jgi:transposase
MEVRQRIYDGATRTEAAKIGGVGLQIIRDWVMRFNAPCIEPFQWPFGR